jgi:hypothetical protein
MRRPMVLLVIGLAIVLSPPAQSDEPPADAPQVPLDHGQGLITQATVSFQLDPQASFCYIDLVYAGAHGHGPFPYELRLSFHVDGGWRFWGNTTGQGPIGSTFLHTDNFLTADFGDQVIMRYTALNTSPYVQGDEAIATLERWC